MRTNEEVLKFDKAFADVFTGLKKLTPELDHWEVGAITEDGVCSVELYFEDGHKVIAGVTGDNPKTAVFDIVKTWFNRA
jgi:hypothetical protein